MLDGGQGHTLRRVEIRPTGRATTGVRGITLKDGARMLGMEISNGRRPARRDREGLRQKRTPVAEYPEQRRGGQGVSTISMTARKGDLVACRVVGHSMKLLMVSEEASSGRRTSHITGVRPRGQDHEFMGEGTTV